MKDSYNKLVRDRIQEIIEESGGVAEIEIMNEDDFRCELLEKLIEEAREAKDAKPGELAAELADLLEVLNTVIAAFGLSTGEVMYQQQLRREKRGGFQGRVKLLNVES